MTAVELVVALAGSCRHADAVELFGLLQIEQHATALSGQVLAEALQTLPLRADGTPAEPNEALRRLMQLFQRMADRAAANAANAASVPSAANANDGAVAGAAANVPAPTNASSSAAPQWGGSAGGPSPATTDGMGDAILPGDAAALDAIGSSLGDALGGDEDDGGEEPASA